MLMRGSWREGERETHSCEGIILTERLKQGINREHTLLFAAAP